MIISWAKFKIYSNIALTGIKLNNVVLFQTSISMVDIIDVVLFEFPLTEIHIYLEL